MDAATNPAVAALEAELAALEAQLAGADAAAEAGRLRAAAILDEARARCRQIMSDARRDASAARVDAATGDLIAQRNRLRKALVILGGNVAALTCPECGYVAKAATGLGAHRHHQHGVSGKTGKQKPAAVAAPQPAAVEVRPAAPAPKPVSPKAERVLACREPACEAEFDVARPSDLMQHTVHAHGRRATQAERTPAKRITAAA